MQLAICPECLGHGEVVVDLSNGGDPQGAGPVQCFTCLGVGQVLDVPARSTGIAATRKVGWVQP